MKYRENGIGGKFKELEKPQTLKIYSKCPTKWLLYDEETGQMYRGMENPPKGHNGWVLIINKNSKI